MRWLAMGLLGASISGRALADDAACVNASEQSLTLRRQGKLQDALKQLATCADPACPDEVKTECTKRIADIDAVQPSLVLGAKDGAGNDLEAVTVTMDGAPLLTTLDGRSVHVDPGEHTFRFTAPHEAPLERTFVVREGEKERHETVTFPAATTPAVAVVATPGVAQRVVGVTALGVGLVGVGLGAVFGVFAVSAQNQEKSDCPAPTACFHAQQAREDYDIAQQNATASTVFFIAGGVLAAAGVVVWLTAPKRVAVTPAVTSHGASLAIRGTW